MKKSIILAAVFALLITGSSFASGIGSVFGTQATASSVGHHVGYFGVGVGLADMTSFVGTFDYGFSKSVTGRMKLGFADAGDQTDAAISFGGELRWQLWEVSEVNNRPFDLSIGAMTEYLKFSDSYNTSFGNFDSDLSVFQLGGFLLGSHSFVMSSGKLLTPYAKLNVRLEDWTSKVSGAGTTLEASDSGLEIGLGTGLAYQLTNSMNLYGEFQVDGNDGVFLGLDFKVM
jgi:hypothetical protein